MSNDNSIILASDDEFTHIYNFLKKYVKRYKLVNNEIKTDEKKYSITLSSSFSLLGERGVNLYFEHKQNRDLNKKFIQHYNKNITSNRYKLISELKLYEVTNFLNFLTNICFKELDKDKNYVLVFTDGLEPKFSIEKISNPFEILFSSSKTLNLQQSDKQDELEKMNQLRIRNKQLDSKNRLFKFQYENIAKEALRIINNYIKIKFITIDQLRKIISSKKKVHLPDRQIDELMIKKIEGTDQCKKMIEDYGKYYSLYETNHNDMIKKLMETPTSDEVYKCLYEKCYYDAYKIMKYKHNFKDCTDEQIIDLYKLIDKIYYNGYLNRKFPISKYTVNTKHNYHDECKYYPSTIFTTKVQDPEDSESYAFCRPYETGHTTIFVNKKKIFEKNNFNYHQTIEDGVACKTKLQSLLCTLKHESVHHLLGPDAMNENDSHGEDFFKITYNLYRHTAYKGYSFNLEKKCGFKEINNLNEKMDTVTDNTIPYNRFLRNRIIYVDQHDKQQIGYPLGGVDKEISKFFKEKNDEETKNFNLNIDINLDKASDSEKIDYIKKNKIYYFKEDGLNQNIKDWQEKKRLIFKLKMSELKKKLDYSEIPFAIHIPTKRGIKKITIPCKKVIGIYEKIRKEYAINLSDLNKNDPIVPTMDPYKIVAKWIMINDNKTIQTNKRIKLV